MSSSCLDAETLAAWANDALTVKERGAAKAHAADCARCQALMAAMVRTAPAPSPAERWWRRPVIGWLVPITALVALAVWVAAPATNRVDVSPARQKAGTEGRREPPVGAPAAPPSSTAAQSISAATALSDLKAKSADTSGKLVVHRTRSCGRMPRRLRPPTPIR